MKLAFCLFKYFPFGGLQRDFLRILRMCKQRGHEIHVFTMRWDAELESGVNLYLIEAKGWQNHSKLRSFMQNLAQELSLQKFDLVIGFNKIPGLDIYYAADVCYKSRVFAQEIKFYRLLPRYRQYVKFEHEVFAKGKTTKIMLISPQQQQEFMEHYQTEAHRFHLLSPGIDRNRIAPENADEIRIKKRKALEIDNENYLLLLVGSAFKTKGLDRAMRALASLPETLRSHCNLYVVGKDCADPFKKLATKLGIGRQVKFFGGRDDVTEFMLAADLLIHPAYCENTGTVLLEAVVAGLPVLTVENCGYAHYISSSKSGIVLPAPFQQKQLNDALNNLLTSEERLQFKHNGLAFAKHANIYDMPANAVDFIEKNMAK